MPSSGTFMTWRNVPSSCPTSCTTNPWKGRSSRPAAFLPRDRLADAVLQGPLSPKQSGAQATRPARSFATIGGNVHNGVVSSRRILVRWRTYPLKTQAWRSRQSALKVSTTRIVSRSAVVLPQTRFLSIASLLLFVFYAALRVFEGRACEATFCSRGTTAVSPALFSQPS